MPITQPALTPTGRLREVASILARGVVRGRKQVKSGQIMPVPGPETAPRIRLEVPTETGLSVSPSTSGLAMRDDGDDECPSLISF